MWGRLPALHTMLGFPFRREVTQQPFGLMRSALSQQLVQELVVAFC